MRRVLAVLAVASAALALPGHAVPQQPQITDPAGDVLIPEPGADIVSGLFATTGTTERIGRRTVYTPTKLLVTVTFANTASTAKHLATVVMFETENCGEVYLESFAGGTNSFGSADCLADPFTPSAKVAGKSITFTVPFGTIGKSHLKKGAELTGLKAYTAVAEPALGYEPAEVGGDRFTLDVAATEDSYVIR